MPSYRTFRNTDPPLLTALWRSRAGQSGLLQPLSVDVLEQLVFAKLYFDYEGLSIACDGDRAVGFAHAGFGPNAERNWISTATGVICIVLVGQDTAESGDRRRVGRPLRAILAPPRRQGYLRRRLSTNQPVLRRIVRRERTAGRARLRYRRPQRVGGAEATRRPNEP